MAYIGKLHKIWWSLFSFYGVIEVYLSQMERGNYSLMNLDYNNSSISSLKDEEKVRRRPAVIFGTNDIHGCAHSIFEIIANAIDEASEGFGREIKIEVAEDNTVTVRDYGRGVPMDWNESEGKYNWELVFCTLYASGKFDNENYSNALGLNGLGATATQYASEFMRVESVRDGKKYTMNFSKGKPVGKLQVENAVGEDKGTEITFKPDREVFTDIEVPIEYYLDTIRRQAMLHRGLKVGLRYKELNETTLVYENGAVDFIDKVCDKRLIKDTLDFAGIESGYEDDNDTEEYAVNMGLSLTFSRGAHLIELYHNRSYLPDGGSSYDALTMAICKAIEDVGRQIGKIGKSERIIFKDVEELLVMVGYTECPGYKTYFKNQTKTAINNKLIKRVYADFVYYNLRRWMEGDKQSAEKVMTEVLLNKKARETADSVKKKIIKRLSASIDVHQGRPSKFKECASKNPYERELFIVEGDSAAGSCVQARDGSFQSIMPLRGKIMNCLKEDLTRILNSEIIVDLMTVLGCGIEAQSKYVKDLPKFDINNLSHHKIIICTDADLDGMQIRCLIITMIYRLAPTLLKKGKVFIAETPLFEITAKDKTVFAYTEEEKVIEINRLIGEGYKESSIKIQRSKGLGENEPEMLSVSTMRPETRRLVSVEFPEDEQGVAMLFEALLGDDIESRRYLVEQYFDYKTEID